MQRPFWKMKSLTQMSREEWESLCDGCGKCCLVQLEDEETGTRDFTDVSCKLLDIGACRCSDYDNRAARVPSCVVLSPINIADVYFMPRTCAYRLLAEGEDLPDWHPLVTGDPESTHRAGYSVRGQTVSETEVDEDDLEDHIRTWKGEA